MTIDPIEAILLSKRHSKPDEHKDFGFTYSHFCNSSSAEVFEGCEVTIDEDHKVIYITGNGYEVAVLFGNTPEWTTPSSCGGFDGALRVFAIKDGEFENNIDGTNNRIFEHILPIYSEE